MPLVVHFSLKYNDVHTYTIVQPWFFDGSVQCFQGAHIFLTIVSLAMLLFLIALIPLTALIIYHRKIKRTVNKYIYTVCLISITHYNFTSQARTVFRVIAPHYPTIPHFLPSPPSITGFISGES